MKANASTVYTNGVFLSDEVCKRPLEVTGQSSMFGTFARGSFGRSVGCWVCAFRFGADDPDAKRMDEFWGRVEFADARTTSRDSGKGQNRGSQPCSASERGSGRQIRVQIRLLFAVSRL